MDAESRSSGNFPSTTASNFWVFQTKAGGVYCHLFTTCSLVPRPQGGEVVTITIRTVEGSFSTLPALQIPPRVLPSTPVWLTYLGLLLTHALPNDASVTTSFVAGVKSVCGANTISAILCSILGFIFGTTTGMIQFLNNSCSKIILLV